MAKLAYCEICKATYPLAIVAGDSRSQKDKSKVPTCPFGHTEIRPVDEVATSGKK
jgi:hypothetical protein